MIIRNCQILNRPGTSLLVLAILAFSVPAWSAPPTQDLKPKRGVVHTKKGYSSVVIWRITVEDHTGDASGYHPRIVIGPPGSSERVTSGRIVEMGAGDYFSTHATASAMEGTWQSDGNVHRFEGFYAVEARPGTYEWFQFKLDTERSGIGSSVSVLTLPPSACTIGEQEFFHVGHLHVVVEERIGSTDEYRMQVRPGPLDLENDLATARRLVPKALAGLPSEPVTRCALLKE